MISSKKNLSDEGIDSHKLMPPFLVVCIFIFITCFVFLARALANSMNQENSIPVYSTDLIRFEEDGGNQQDLEMNLPAILRMIGIKDDTKDHEVVYRILANDFKHKAVNMSTEELQQVHSKIIDLQEIIGQEATDEFNDMSLEGRRLIVYITQEVFELYGYRVTLGLDGNIEKISELSGKIVYSKTRVTHSELHIKGLVFILSFVLLALLICILIAKKKQLFKKDVRYDGLNKKRFA